MRQSIGFCNVREAGTMTIWECGIGLCAGQYDVDIWKSVGRFQ